MALQRFSNDDDRPKGWHHLRTKDDMLIEQSGCIIKFPTDFPLDVFQGSRTDDDDDEEDGDDADAGWNELIRNLRCYSTRKGYKFRFSSQKKRARKSKGTTRTIICSQKGCKWQLALEQVWSGSSVGYTVCKPTRAAIQYAEQYLRMEHQGRPSLQSFALFPFAQPMATLGPIPSNMASQKPGMVSTKLLFQRVTYQCPKCSHQRWSWAIFAGSICLQCHQLQTVKKIFEQQFQQVAQKQLEFHVLLHQFMSRENATQVFTRLMLCYHKTLARNYLLLAVGGMDHLLLTIHGSIDGRVVRKDGASLTLSLTNENDTNVVQSNYTSNVDPTSRVIYIDDIHNHPPAYELGGIVPTMANSQVQVADLLEKVEYDCPLCKGRRWSWTILQDVPCLQCNGLDILKELFEQDLANVAMGKLDFVSFFHKFIVMENAGQVFSRLLYEYSAAMARNYLLEAQRQFRFVAEVSNSLSSMPVEEDDLMDVDQSIESYLTA